MSNRGVEFLRQRVMNREFGLFLEVKARHAAVGTFELDNGEVFSLLGCQATISVGRW